MLPRLNICLTISPSSCNFSKDDVFQKLDNVFVGHLEQYYNSNKIEYNKYLDFLKSSGYIMTWWLTIFTLSNCGQSVSQKKIISTRLENYSVISREQEDDQGDHRWCIGDHE